MAHGKAWMVAHKKCDPPCEDCAEAYAQYLRQQRQRKGSGTSDVRVKAEGTQQRLLVLHQTYLISANEIGARIRMSDAQVRRIMNGEISRVYRSTALKVLSLYTEVTAAPPVRVAYDVRYVSSHLTRLALRGLAAQGYSRTWIRSKIGLDLNTIWVITQDEDQPKSRKKILRDTEERVLKLVREVGSTDGGNAYTRSKARDRGWKPTMYYDELV